SFLNQKMEFTDAFSEEEYGEKTPLPVTLKNYDLKDDYSTQTSNHVASLYNVFTMKQNADDIFVKYNDLVNEAMDECQNQYDIICRRENIKPVGKIKTVTYRELYDYTPKKNGTKKKEEIITAYIKKEDEDDRGNTLRLDKR